MRRLHCTRPEARRFDAALLRPPRSTGLHAGGARALRQPQLGRGDARRYSFPMRSALMKGFLASVLAFLGGCGNLGYYIQSAGGQFDILGRAKPIGEVLANPGTPAELRNKLVSAQAAREFASRELALPDNRSYRNYAELERPYVVWNVFAAREFSTQLHEWCFPVAGCVNYRGYFSRPGAESYA